jgi:glycerate 2-kinase
LEVKLLIIHNLWPETDFDNWRKDIAVTALEAGVASVNGRNAVGENLRSDFAGAEVAILAIGKAASSMCLGALEVLGCDTLSMVVTKYDHVDAELETLSNVRIIQSGHPIPDEQSLYAGREVIRFVEGLGENSALVVLVSGGASALIEALPSDMGLNDLQELTEEWIAGGKTIEEINAARIQISEIKGGKLLHKFRGKEIRSYFISDVPADDISVIGSGIGCLPNDGSSQPKFSSFVIGTNALARSAIAKWSDQAGLKVVINDGSLGGDVFDLSKRLSDEITAGEDGIYIWGGEPTIVLPDNPGQGGRNQSLALSLAGNIKQQTDIAIVAAGTDGTDGPTDAAGGIIDGDTFDKHSDAERALKDADAGAYLQKAGDLYVSGPTGTNVMDIVVGVKLSSAFKDFGHKLSSNRSQINHK